MEAIGADDRGPVRVVVKTLENPTNPQIVDLVRDARRSAVSFQKFIRSRESQLRVILSEMSEGFVSHNTLRSIDTSGYSILGNRYLFAQLPKGIIVVPDKYMDEKDFFVFRRFLFKVKVTGISYEKVIENQKEFSADLADRVTRQVQKKRSRRRVAIVIDNYEPGSLEFMAGIGVGAAALQLVSLIKDYPNIKKGLKEAADDLSHAVKKAAEKIKKKD